MSRHNHPARPAPHSPASAMPEQAADAAAPAQAAVREKTLAELNREAWATDAEHARRRDEADAAAREHVAPLLEGTIRGRQRTRRMQKPVAPPYRVAKAS